MHKMVCVCVCYGAHKLLALQRQQAPFGEVEAPEMHEVNNLAG